MAEPHVISALRSKRAEISGHIHDLQKKITRLRASLAGLDATIRIFAPGMNPDEIPPKRGYRRSQYFERGEFGRLLLDILRNEQRPMTIQELARAILTARGLSPDDRDLTFHAGDKTASTLRSLRKRGAVVKMGEGKGTKWSLA